MLDGLRAFARAVGVFEREQQRIGAGHDEVDLSHLIALSGERRQERAARRVVDRDDLVDLEIGRRVGLTLRVTERDVPVERAPASVVAREDDDVTALVQELALPKRRRPLEEARRAPRVREVHVDERGQVVAARGAEGPRSMPARGDRTR